MKTSAEKGVHPDLLTGSFTQTGFCGAVANVS